MTARPDPARFLPVLSAAADETLATPPLFGPAQQARFCEALAAHGNARAAARVAGISPQTAYRMRRASAAFRQMWNAALVHARAQVEEVLAVRAIEGVEEAVFYHGEEVAVRRRYDARLLLAHLARLDKLADRAETALLAEEFEAGLAALATGADLPGVKAEDAAEDAAGEGPAEEREAIDAAPPPPAAAAPDPHGLPCADDLDPPCSLLEAQLRWLEARFGTLSEEEEIFHLQNTVPGVPAEDLAALGWPPARAG